MDCIPPENLGVLCEHAKVFQCMQNFKRTPILTKRKHQQQVSIGDMVNHISTTETGTVYSKEKHCWLVRTRAGNFHLWKPRECSLRRQPEVTRTQVTKVVADTVLKAVYMEVEGKCLSIFV